MGIKVGIRPPAFYEKVVLLRGMSNVSRVQANWGRGGASGCAGEGESRGAVVVTLESTSVSACSSGALVSKGRFVGLCLRFADDFEASLDDWQPRADDPPPNLAAVSEGTYEVCSRTAAAKHNGKLQTSL